MSAWAYRAKPRETAVRPESSTCQTASRTAVEVRPSTCPSPVASRISRQGAR